MANAILLVILAIGLLIIGAAWRLLEGAVGRWGLAGIFAAVVTAALIFLWQRLRQVQVDNLWTRLHQAEADIEELGQRVQKMEKKQTNFRMHPTANLAAPTADVLGAACDFRLTAPPNRNGGESAVSSGCRPSGPH